MLCTASTAAAIHAPVGPAHYQAGRLTLADGTTFEVWGDAQGKAFLADVRTGDRIEICFAPTHVWADEPVGARSGFAVDMRSNVTYTSVGLPGSAAMTFPPAGGSKRRTL